MAQLRARIEVSEDGLFRQVRLRGLPQKLVYQFVAPPKDPPQILNGNMAAIALNPWATMGNHDLHIEEAVDATLLDNLRDFQAIWALWFPDKFRKIKITADEIIDEYRAPVQQELESRAILSLSCGVDSMFSLLELMTSDHRSVKLTDTLLVHGFDYPLSARQGFGNLQTQAAGASDMFGLDLWVVKTNWRAFCPDWEFTHIQGNSAIQHQFNATHRVGFLADDRWLGLPKPENNGDSNSLVTKTLLSSSVFQTRGTGGTTERTDKISAIGRRPELLRKLRVCWEGPRNGANCGDCEKCVRTQLGLLAANVPKPWPFPIELTPRRVREMQLKSDILVGDIKLILARLQSMTQPNREIIEAVEQAVERYGHHAEATPLTGNGNSL